jgi:hypothetical protein
LARLETNLRSGHSYGYRDPFCLRCGPADSLDRREGKRLCVVICLNGYTSGNMTGTNEDGTEIDSGSLVSFCYANSVVLDVFLANSGKVEQKVSANHKLMSFYNVLNSLQRDSFFKKLLSNGSLTLRNSHIYVTSPSDTLIVCDPLLTKTRRYRLFEPGSESGYRRPPQKIWLHSL